MGTSGIARETPSAVVRELRIKLVPPNELNDYWPAAAKILARASPQGNGFRQRNAGLFTFMALPDMYVEVYAGRWQLWLLGDEKEAYACMLTEFRRYPCALVFDIVHAGAAPDRNALELVTFYEYIERWVMREGATWLRIPCARKGWQKILTKHGYEQQGVVLQKRLHMIKEH